MNLAKWMFRWEWENLVEMAWELVPSSLVCSAEHNLVNCRAHSSAMFVNAWVVISVKCRIPFVFLLLRSLRPIGRMGRLIGLGLHGLNGPGCTVTYKNDF